MDASEILTKQYRVNSRFAAASCPTRRAPDVATATLTITVGDWAKAPDGKAQDTYDTSVEFAETAARKIKALAEKH